MSSGEWDPPEFRGSGRWSILDDRGEVGALGASTTEHGFLRAHAGRLALCVLAVVLAGGALPIMWMTWGVALMNTAFSFPVMAVMCLLVILAAVCAPVHWWIRFRRFRAIGEEPEREDDEVVFALDEPLPTADEFSATRDATSSNIRW